MGHQAHDDSGYRWREPLTTNHCLRFLLQFLAQRFITSHLFHEIDELIHFFHVTSFL